MVTALVTIPSAKEFAAARKGLCYGPYKQDSTGTQRKSKTGQDQCARGGTDGTSGAMG